MGRIKRVVLIQPESAGGNFEYVAIPRQGMLFLSGALGQWDGDFLYDREIWFEDKSGRIDLQKDLEGVDILMVSALINEAPRGYEIGRLAKQYHPNIKTIGGGPQMGPLCEEAIREGLFDVIVQREGEDIIGQLSDVLLKYEDDVLDKSLLMIPGISFMRGGEVVQTPRRGVIDPDFVELPDFASVKDLTSQRPWAGGVLETVRGCTEKCSYCQVIQQFLGYRMVSRETEIKRLAQLKELAADGLINTNRDGKFAVFISDDLHPPPLRAVKYRNERLERLRSWKDHHTDGMYMICQARAEIGQDPELYSAMQEAGIDMLYLGVESSNAQNLEAVGKRQDPNQVNKDLEVLNKTGFAVVAMTIIGLPFDTEKSIMDMAEWAVGVSKYQTANLLTPLPATVNWDTLAPLDENGDLLPEGKMRPYHLYTGRQLVHQDERWTMQESRQLYDKYYSKLNPVDTLYSRIFRLLKRKGVDLFAEENRINKDLPVIVRQIVGETLKVLSDSAATDLAKTTVARIQRVSESLTGLAESINKGMTENVSARIDYMGESVKNLAEAVKAELAETTYSRINKMSSALRSLAKSVNAQELTYSG